MKSNRTSVFFIIILYLFCVPSFPCFAERFTYTYIPGDQYRILSTVIEDVYVDRILSHRAEILNRIAVKVTGLTDGKGMHTATFQTSERSVGVSGGSSFQWSREYESVFQRDTSGRLNIDPGYFMPVVRNVPVFPDKDIVQGESWFFPGEEVHDFRDSFGISEPYRIPFTANYTYLGPREWKGRNYLAFSVTYQIFHEPDAVQGAVYPKRIMGASDQVLLWNTDLGQPGAYEEEFRMIFELSNGQRVEYRGYAEAELLETKPMDREQVADEIMRELEEWQVSDTSVRVVEEGVSISLDNVRFLPDSAVLQAGELEKLDHIVEILKKYPDRDILVGGHTALAGTPEGRQTLSTERAATVAEYLLRQGARIEEQVVVRGYGADIPVADNSTEEGMRKNRRVEIVILEN